MSKRYNATLYLIGGGHLELGTLDEDGLDTLHRNLGEQRGRMRFSIEDEIHLIPLTSIHSIRAVKVAEGAEA